MAEATSIEDLREKLAYARERLEAANEAMRAADRREEAAHEMGGGIPGFGASGSQRAARQVRSALDSSYRAWKDASERIEKWAYRVKRLEARVADMERPRLTREDVLGASQIHDGTFWRKVVKVNAKTVSVDSGYSWVDRVPFEEIRDYRPRNLAQESGGES